MISCWIWLVRDIAGAAEDLDCAVGNPAHHLACEIFGRGRFHDDPLALVLATGRLQHQGASGHGFGLGISDHRLDELEVGDRPAELASLA
jgi:hypothetical protein